MSKHKAHKTNAMRELETAGISYTTAEYDVDESDLSGVHVAAVLGQSADQVFKTLVLEDGVGGHVVCCIPSNCELDMKAVARAAGVKRVEMLPLKNLTAVTGYVRGGCSPLGMKKSFPTFIDETAQLFDEIAISAGERGQQIIVDPLALAQTVNASFAALCR